MTQFVKILLAIFGTGEALCLKFGIQTSYGK